MMTSFPSLGCLMRNVVYISQVTVSQPIPSCTQDHHPLHQCTPPQQYHHSAYSPGPSYRALTNSSLFSTVLVPMMLASGDLSQLRYRNPCPCTLHASRMAASSSNSTSVILLTCNTMQSILASGCNTTLSLNSNPHYNGHTPYSTI
jgi:hypothetical protein